MNAIILEKITKQYRDNLVLKEVDLKIAEGEFYALMGPNGSGKTTLISIIASVNAPSSGKIEIYGKKPEKAKDLIGYIPQENFSSPLLTGKENLMYMAGLLGYSDSTANKIVYELLKKIGLLGDSNKRVSDYSGGMRKRLEIATALFPNIKILILDEPTTGLDPSARRKFLGLLQELRNDKTTIILVTHIGADAELASRVGLMNDGKIIAEDQPEQLKKKSGLENVVNIETIFKNAKVTKILSKFSKKNEIIETETGYRVFIEETEESIPKIVRSLDDIGCKVIRIEATEPSLEDVFFKLTEKRIREVD